MVNITGDCQPLTFAPNTVLKSPLMHHVGIDAAQSYAFGFPYAPCSPRLKPTYTLLVKKAGVTVPATWLTVNDATPTDPRLTIDSTNPADKGTYIVVISAKLNTTPTARAATDTITLEVFLKVDSCYKTVFVADHEFSDMKFKIKD